MPSKTAKKSTKTTTRPSGAATGKSAAKRATVASLALDLKSLEKRLKGADTKNRKALTALEAVVEDVKTSAKNTTTAQKAALTRGLNTLEIRMETYLERAAAEARAGVRSELSSVTASGADLSTLEQAVQAAHARLDDLDSTQRNALARLNRHIASIATSVDNRLKEEAQAREDITTTLDAKIDSVRESFETRVNRVEQETADALQVVGDRITEFASVLENRAKTSDVDTAERLADLAQETQAEFNSVHTDVTTRLEALEMIASAWSPSESAAPAANPYVPANADDPRIDQMGEMIQTLQDELSRMHARMAAVSTKSDAQPTAPSNVVSMAPVLSTPQDNPYAEAVRALEIKTAEPVAPAPVAETPEEPTPSPARESHVPQEYDPSAYAPQAPLPTITEPAAAAPLMAAPLAAIPAAVQAAPLAPPPPPPALPTPPAPPPMASSGAFEMPKVDPLPTIDSYVPDVEPLMPAPLPVTTYDDPAYAEHDEMRAERIGGDFAKPSILSNLPITGRNLRVGALVVGVSVVGLLAGKTILGGSDKTELVTNDVPAVEAVEGGVQNASFANPNSNDFSDQPAQATAPLGLYAETQTPTIGASEQNSLDAAVAAGNPIAQFQKGLVKLQSGQMKEGARLIRLAANRNQPAAQYRLAKLYESGTGISKDTVTARELIERAASGGNRIAMHDLGNYHAYGQGGLERDMGQALDWFTKAAERGVVDSQFNVAFLREGNEGVTADLETAMFWYFVAARQGDQGAPDRINALKNEFDASTLNDIQTRAARFNPKPVDEAANGVFRNVPWNKIAPQTAAVEAAVKSAEIIRVRDAQTLLSELGYEVGAPDGISGKKTRDAVKSFEAVNGLPETGQVTDELIRKLEIATGA